MSKPKVQKVILEKDKVYAIDAAAEMVTKLSTSKFVGSVDIDVVLDVPEKHKKTNVSGSVSLPHQSGTAKKVVVFANPEDAKAAKAAGAKKAGLEDLVADIEGGDLDFDVVLATPEVMSKIAKLGKILGPRALMPNPNNGTISANIVDAVKVFVAGKQNFKMSDQQSVRAKVGKIDQTPTQIAENIKVFLKAVFTESRKVNSQPFRKITISPTMGKGVRIDISDVIANIA
jgi:large subunit ribosomal protein L1